MSFLTDMIDELQYEIEKLKKENAELRQQIQELRRLNGLEYDRGYTDGLEDA